MRLCWLTGHSKKYVGVEDVIWEGEFGLLDRPCSHDKKSLFQCDICGKSVQIARWVCECGQMGETYIPHGTGIYRVDFGKLVPDEKRWANHLSLTSK